MESNFLFCEQVSYLFLINNKKKKKKKKKKFAVIKYKYITVIDRSLVNQNVAST